MSKFNISPGAELDAIVATSKMPLEQAISLLSSAVLYETRQCDFNSFVDAVAHTRLEIPADFQDATAALAGWLDVANAELATRSSSKHLHLECDANPDGMAGADLSAFSEELFQVVRELNLMRSYVEFKSNARASRRAGNPDALGHEHNCDLLHKDMPAWLRW